MVYFNSIQIVVLYSLNKSALSGFKSALSGLSKSLDLFIYSFYLFQLSISCLLNILRTPSLQPLPAVSFIPYFLSDLL